MMLKKIGKDVRPMSLYSLLVVTAYSYRIIFMKIILFLRENKYFFS
ncbi:hypothetical protein HMPREF9148_00342 [Prevotella sp. F0091]|nr:hypothetical protein HMPREF9148_00342 [Prevotella sp. F0091]